MPTVHTPRLRRVRQYPLLSAMTALALLAGVVWGGIWGYGRLFPPPLSCGAGMMVSGSPPACVGVNLDSVPFSATESPRLRQLQTLIKRANDDVTGPYASVVLLLNLTPVAGVDTVKDSSAYPNIEGAITAVWRANHTAAFGGSLRIKLFLANMGSLYGSWSDAVEKINANAASQHITSVIGLGQSTDQTRAAAAWLSSEAHLPVIGATVTGDSMNADPRTGKDITNFFRVSSTNSNSVTAASQFVSGLEPTPSTIAVVKDTVGGDDYTATLGKAADQNLGSLGRTVTSLPFTSPTSMPSGVQRRDYLVQQFNFMHDNLCQTAPDLVYFAGRGNDLGAFVDSWVQGARCGPSDLIILSGDDASASINDPSVDKAIATGRVTVYFTSLASPDEWGTDCSGSGAKANYDQFWTAFTGRADPCTHQTIEAAKAAPLSFDEKDLGSGQAMLSHDAAVAAIAAARQDALALKDPQSQTAVLHQLYCTHMLPGASGRISFAGNGNPADKPVPVVRIAGNGDTSTVKLTWPDGREVLNRPAPGQTSGC